MKHFVGIVFRKHFLVVLLHPGAYGQCNVTCDWCISICTLNKYCSTTHIFNFFDLNSAETNSSAVLRYLATAASSSDG